MFCTSLRKQPEWATIIPSLLSSTSPKFHERTLSTHDIAFPLPLTAAPSTTTNNQNNKTNNPRPAYLYFLLLTPTSLHEPNRSQTLARIDRLSTLTGNTKDVGIIFLLSDPDSQKQPTSTDTFPSAPSSSARGTHAFMELQLLMHTSPTTIPLLPLPTPQHLLPTLHHYPTTALSAQAARSSHPTRQPRKTFALTHLLPTATTTYPPHPLPQHATNVLSDIVPSLRGLVDVVGSERGRRELCGYLGEGVVGELVEFWGGGSGSLSRCWHRGRGEEDGGVVGVRGKWEEGCETLIGKWL